MDNQKSNDGNARYVGSEGSGSSMGRDMSRDAGINKGASSVHNTIDKAAEAAQPMAERLATSAHAGVDKVSSALTDVSGRVDEKTKQLGEAYKHFAETGRGYVRTKPATSVLVALGAGFVLSKLLGRRH